MKHTSIHFIFISILHYKISSKDVATKDPLIQTLAVYCPTHVWKFTIGGTAMYPLMALTYAGIRLIKFQNFFAISCTVCETVNVHSHLTTGFVSTIDVCTCGFNCINYIWWSLLESLRFTRWTPRQR